MVEHATAHALKPPQAWLHVTAEATRFTPLAKHIRPMYLAKTSVRASLNLEDEGNEGDSKNKRANKGEPRGKEAVAHARKGCIEGEAACTECPPNEQNQENAFIVIPQRGMLLSPPRRSPARRSQK